MTQTSPQKPERLTIKKYPNRRYYDSTRSRHVTFEEIFSLVREGHDVQITDSKTGEDITAKVLTQLIIELDSLKLGVFPVPLLHGILRATPQAVAEYVKQYFTQMLGAYLDSQGQLQQYVQRMMGLGGAAPALADWARVMLGQAGGGGRAGTPSARVPTVVDEAGRESTDEDLRRELESLRRQMQSLRQRIGPAGRKRPRKRP